MRYWRVRRRSSPRTSSYYKYKIISLLSAAVVAYLIGFVQDFRAKPDNTSIQGIARIKDGDSLDVNGNVVRLFGIDAPELSQTCKKDNKKWKCGADAKEALQILVKDKNIFCIQMDKDKYKRADSNCYFYDEQNSKINIGQEMVKSGYAIAYKTFSPRYLINQWLAKISSKGIWASKFQQPSRWRKQHKSGRDIQ